MQSKDSREGESKLPDSFREAQVCLNCHYSVLENNGSYNTTYCMQKDKELPPNLNVSECYKWTEKEFEEWEKWAEGRRDKYYGNGTCDKWQEIKLSTQGANNEPR